MKSLFRTNMRRLVLALMVMEAALVVIACPKSSVQTLAKTVDEVAIANQGFQAGAQSARAANLISAAEDIQLQKIVIQVAAINENLVAATRAENAGNPSWKADVDAALALGVSLNASSTAFIKDANTRAELTAILVGVRAMLDTISMSIKGAPIAAPALPPAPAPGAAPAS